MTNETFYPPQNFSKQAVLQHVPRSREDEAAALRYLDKHAPDVIGMVLGGVL
jgi:hypothetical protein